MKHTRAALVSWLDAGVAALIALAGSSVAGAADRVGNRTAVREKTTISATSVEEATAIRLDGELTEDVWQKAPKVTGFLQREPHEGAAASLQTEVRVAYDGSSLYVAVRAFDREPDKIAGYLTRRDAESPSDWIRVIVDSYHDRRTAYEFAVNPAGVKQDKYWFNDGTADDSWDAVWDVSVGRDAEGWKAEFRIPFSQLRFNVSSSDTFGFAVVRQIGRLNETSTWPLLPKSASGYVSSFGELKGLVMSHSPKRLEVVPYTVAQFRTQPGEAGNPLIETRDPGAAVGLDLKYSLTPGLTLTSTLNPDFGQVEADPAVVNLSAFETFFAERRPFFVEGSGVFRFDIDCSDDKCTGLFYSRRIGREPQGNGELPDEDGTYAAAPLQTTIVGAAKLTGRLGGFSVGALQAVTSQETAQVASSGGRHDQVVEPLTSYAVVRARREFGNQSSLGFMTTATNRQLNDAVRFLPGQAYTGGVDWDWRLAPEYSLSGYWAGSALHGEAAAIERLQENNRHSFQRPDAKHIELDSSRTSLNGHSGRVSIGKIAGKRVRFNSSVGFKSPGFDINDVGFVRRADERSLNNWLQLRNDIPSKHFRRVRVNFNQYAGWNFGGDTLWSGANVNAHAVFANNWATGGGINFEHRAFDDRLTRGGPGGLAEGYLSGWQYLDTDDRKPVSFSTFLGGGRDGHGSWFRDIEPAVTIRPMSSLSINSGIRFGRNVRDTQWIEKVTEPETHYVFGTLNQTTVSLTARLNYTIRPTLSMQMYAQPFVSAGDYTGFRELVNGRAAQYQDRYSPFAYSDNPDFNVRSFRTTNVLRWEYRPGSTLFVVWQQGRDEELDRGDFRFRRDFHDVFGVPSTNVVLVKFAYWLNY